MSESATIIPPRAAFQDIERLRAMARPAALQAPGPKPTAALQQLPGRHAEENKLLGEAIARLEHQLSTLDGGPPQAAPALERPLAMGLVAQIEDLCDDTTALRHRIAAAADRLQAILQGPATRLSS